jgi:hypothetical protein
LGHSFAEKKDPLATIKNMDEGGKRVERLQKELAAKGAFGPVVGTVASGSASKPSNTPQSGQPQATKVQSNPSTLYQGGPPQHHQGGPPQHQQGGPPQHLQSGQSQATKGQSNSSTLYQGGPPQHHQGGPPQHLQSGQPQAMKGQNGLPQATAGQGTPSTLYQGGQTQATMGQAGPPLHQAESLQHQQQGNLGTVYPSGYPPQQSGPPKMMTQVNSGTVYPSGYPPQQSGPSYGYPPQAGSMTPQYGVLPQAGQQGGPPKSTAQSPYAQPPNMSYQPPVYGNPYVPVAPGHSGAAGGNTAYFQGVPPTVHGEALGPQMRQPLNTHVPTNEGLLWDKPEPKHGTPIILGLDKKELVELPETVKAAGKTVMGVCKGICKGAKEGWDKSRKDDDNA